MRLAVQLLLLDLGRNMTMSEAGRALLLVETGNSPVPWLASWDAASILCPAPSSGCGAKSTQLFCVLQYLSNVRLMREILRNTARGRVPPAYMSLVDLQ